MDQDLKKGLEVELDIESLAFGTKGVSRLNGYVIFVEEALPGQRVRAQILKKKKDYAEARTLAVIRQSPSFVEPRCRHFEDCGGCLLQNLRYDVQLASKQQQVTEILTHLGGLADPPVLPIIGSPQIFFYRNKMEFSFSRQRWVTRAEMASGESGFSKDFALGLHARNSYAKTLTIEECHLQSSLSNRILDAVRAFTEKHRLLPYTTFGHTGFWRFLVIREGKRTGEVMVNVITTDVPGGREAVQQLADALLAEVPQITTIVHNLNRSKAQVATGEEEFVLHGPGHLHERLGPFVFRISANSFFQTNTEGAERLYQVVRDFAALTGEETVYDLYCGAGTISIFVSQQARQVIGFEIVPQAIHDAGVNCRLNAVMNCEFILGDLKDELAQVPILTRRWGKPDVVIIDPPRAGMHPKVVKKIIELAPKRIIYVSCNPSTLARDVKELSVTGYRLKKAQPVDMFPHTSHIEVVGVLEC
ncbi:MAG: 23S rRNA (uracil(1939)-C(5))-methyltransferase RlmD [candidate division KSB1 bacterium]|nr:23S rRNA (uracil(1939)-C(5))-methyltransferase RlmD [candidate division KSB1 bacterium]MDZ7302147.1 23S rRNA (uracil(1939)-C(5))-methyltransferase RlmD [candidate division KSB1 bacterium]MDZ7311257.1 23S rRNA (uracil(1939)-C(5))-methyltransferase RlmD [candidate division KSB1 bacterium]